MGLLCLGGSRTPTRRRLDHMPDKDAILLASGACFRRGRATCRELRSASGPAFHVTGLLWGFVIFVKKDHGRGFGGEFDLRVEVRVAEAVLATVGLARGCITRNR